MINFIYLTIIRYKSFGGIKYLLYLALKFIKYEKIDSKLSVRLGF